jgi:hypothetical protein
MHIHPARNYPVSSKVCLNPIRESKSHCVYVMLNIHHKLVSLPTSSAETLAILRRMASFSALLVGRRRRL